ncbi:MAG: hypothetical protein BWK78_04670 [Thiotrichaceae bacterium IS1]|nr:MAG: hypothetical protein BWK78_04670 [Thiotrichaceae bacterium IS1]
MPAWHFWERVWKGGETVGETTRALVHARAWQRETISTNIIMVSDRLDSVNFSWYFDILK